jgi:hypothetical protein
MSYVNYFNMEGNDKPRIFPLENKSIDVHTHEIIIYGFLDAAELIVTNCESKKHISHCVPHIIK